MPLVLFNKPFRVLSQFTSDGTHRTLKDFIDVPDVYPAGRLDFDSEGLLVLTDDGRLQARISQPRAGHAKAYLAQVEGEPGPDDLARLLDGVTLKDGPAKAHRAEIVDEPANLWPRTPPIRERKAIPTRWIRIELREGRNRQVRRMTAAIGFPTLRLVRSAVGPWALNGLRNGDYRMISNREAWAQLNAVRR